MMSTSLSAWMKREKGEVAALGIKNNTLGKQIKINNIRKTNEMDNLDTLHR